MPQPNRLLFLLIAGCTAAPTATPDGASPGPDAAAGADASSGVRTLASCTTDVAADAPAFFKRYFRCVTITTTATGVAIASDDLPPHQSYYWGAGNANYVAFDTRGGAYHANPNSLSKQSVSVKVPSSPTPVGVTITTDYVDGKAGDNSLEYRGGPIGVALDGVSLYGGFAAPGGDLDVEAFTFDTYDGHPDDRGSYHYHAPTPGPLEVLTAAGTSGVELYGILCDGTVVLGCTELDGSTPAGALDAQGGHVGDLKDADGTLYFSGRYHVHVCADAAHGYKYTPEIHYYGACI